MENPLRRQESLFRRAVKLCRFNKDITDPLYKLFLYAAPYFCELVGYVRSSIIYVGRMLGHKTTIMTQRYAPLSPDYMNSIDKLLDFDIKI